MDGSCLDADTIGVEMGEAILEDLMEDIVLSCVNRSTESEYTADPLENTSSMNL